MYTMNMMLIWLVDVCISSQKNDTLLSLRLNGNKIGNSGGMFFAQMLQINATLESLDLGDTDLVSVWCRPTKRQFW